MACIRAFFQVVGRAEVAGVDVPHSGPVLLACNHASYFDPVLVGCFLPRPLSIITRKTLWKSSLLGWAMDHFEMHSCGSGRRDGGRRVQARDIGNP